MAGTGQIYVHSQQESFHRKSFWLQSLLDEKRVPRRKEFVAFLELVEHEFVPVKSKGIQPQEASNNLNMSVRLRVVDLRSEFPKIVLQEMIRDTYFVPKTLIPTDYSVEVWEPKGLRSLRWGLRMRN